MSGKKVKIHQMIPAEIRSLVTERHILASEDPKGYDDLFAGLIAMFKPTNVLQWLRLKNLLDLLWEQQRISRIKPALVDAMQKNVVESALNSLPMNTKLKILGALSVDSQHLEGWFTDDEVKEKLEQLLRCFNCSEVAIDGMAFLERMTELEALDKMQMANEGRQAMVCRQLEEDKTITQLHTGTKYNEEQEVTYTQPLQMSHAARNNDACVQDDEELGSDHKEDAESDNDIEAGTDFEPDGSEEVHSSEVASFEDEEESEDTIFAGDEIADEDEAA